MMYARDAHGHVLAPSKTVDGFCPGCRDKLIAKCGETNAHHWAHTSADCDPWHENEGPWHRRWKSCAKPEHTEVVLGPHRADIRRGQLTIELQHSPMAAEEVRERDNFYNAHGQILWLLDGTEANIEVFREGGVHWFTWKQRRRSFDRVGSPLGIDLGVCSVCIRKTDVAGVAQDTVIRACTMKAWPYQSVHDKFYMSRYMHLILIAPKYEGRTDERAHVLTSDEFTSRLIRGDRERTHGDHES